MTYLFPEYASAIAEFQPLSEEQQRIASNQELIQSYLKLAVKIAKKYNNGTELGNLISDANLAVIAAIEKWDRERPLTPYVVTCIENTLKRAVGNQGLVYVPHTTRKQLKKSLENVSEKRRKQLIAAEAVQSIASVCWEDGEVELPERAVNIPEGFCLADIIQVRNRLHGIPRHVFSHFFKLNKRTRNLSVSELARRYGLKVSGVKKIIEESFRFRKCKFCDSDFRATDSRKIFCSSKCAKSYHDHVRSVAQRTPSLSVKCEWCGTSFTTSKRKQKFCSLKCSRFSRAMKKPEKIQDHRPCKECGKVFLPDVGQRIYCSSKCSDRNRRRKWLQRMPKFTCLNCGGEFVPKGLSQKFCSRSCGVQYNNPKKLPIIV